MDLLDEAAKVLDAPVGRRAAIATVGAAAGLAALAACGAKSAATGSASAGAAGGSGSPAVSSASGSPSASPSESTAAGGGALVALADVPVGGSVAAKDADGKPILIAQPTAGKVVAFTAICTHQGCTVKPAGMQFQCPCHGSKYDAATGKVLGGPAPAPLAAVPVHVAGGKVVAGA